MLLQEVHTYAYTHTCTILMKLRLMYRQKNKASRFKHATYAWYGTFSIPATTRTKVYPVYSCAEKSKTINGESWRHFLGLFTVYSELNARGRSRAVVIV